MATMTETGCRLCRREGLKLFLKGTRCMTDKCSIQRRSYPPGQHGLGRTKSTEYGIQLREKQKLKRVYGVLERQLRKMFAEASRRKGRTGENLLQMLETRLDTVVYRAGFGASMRESRQLVSHGHIEVNGKSVNVASYLLRRGDQVRVREKSQQQERIRLSVERTSGQPKLSWLDVDNAGLVAKIVDMPPRAEIRVPVNEQLIVEHYSR